jgi:hypothetical protein
MAKDGTVGGDAACGRARGGPSLDRLVRDVRRLSADLTRSQDRCEAVLEELLAVRRVIVINENGASVRVTEDALRRARALRRQQSRAAAIVTAQGDGASVELRLRPEGGAHVRIADGRWFKVPALLAHLLSALTSAPACRDGFPTWQSIDEVSRRIGQKAGRAPTHHAIRQGVFRLRNLMREAGANPHLVQGHKMKGLRVLTNRVQPR